MALIIGTAPALVTLSVTEKHQPRALGVYAMLMASGLAMGAPLGGFLLQIWDWPSVYFFRVPYTGVLLGLDDISNFGFGFLSRNGSRSVLFR
jgi:predicted MFS family arabinose efflux permease